MASPQSGSVAARGSLVARLAREAARRQGFTGKYETISTEEFKAEIATAIRAALTEAARVAALRDTGEGAAAAIEALCAEGAASIASAQED